MFGLRFKNEIEQGTLLTILTLVIGLASWLLRSYLSWPRNARFETDDQLAAGVAERIERIVALPHPRDFPPLRVRIERNHRPRSLRHRSLSEAMDVQERSPHRLDALFRIWSGSHMYKAPPSLVFAVIGQAKANEALSPEDESDLLVKLLTHWAMRGTLDASTACLAPCRRISTPSLASI